MFKNILSFKTALMIILGLVLFCPGVFAQGHQDRASDTHARGNGRSAGHGTRHYYHNGNWNRNGWFGWGVQAPMLSNGYIVGSLPPGYTVVQVQGNTYYYGENRYFRQLPSGGYTVVTVPIGN